MKDETGVIHLCAKYYDASIELFSQTDLNYYGDTKKMLQLKQLHIYFK